ncbi:MAG: hypothetical protein ABH884_00500 [Candidatus Komeilibacteria bacterium]
MWEELLYNPKFKIVILVFVILLIISNVITVYALFFNDDSDEIVYFDEQILNDDLDLGFVDGQINNDNNQNIAQDSIVVEWTEWPIETNIYDFLSRTKVEEYAASFEDYTLNAYDFISALEVFKVGDIKQGLYAGKELYIVTVVPMGPAPRKHMLRVIKDGDSPIILEKYSDQLWTPHREFFTEFSDITIADFETPEFISIPNSDYRLVQTLDEPFLFVNSYSQPAKIFKYNGVDYVYKDIDKKCFFVKGKDGTAREYNIDLDFLGIVNSDLSKGSVPTILDFTLLNGEQNTEEYMYRTTGGCRGYINCFNYVDYLDDTSSLKKIGQAADGTAIYILADTTIKESDSAEMSVLESLYDQYYPGYDSENNKPKEKVAVADFVNENPILFWRDPFGQYLAFTSAKYLPAVECGKPVIYLYPEEETAISVKVAPNGGFTKVEPDYNEGWYVLANPQGELYNYADQITYPYLFWEGIGFDYHLPKEGFVVAQKDIENFLVNKLSYLGLIKSEYDEFIDFWLPRMQDQPFYFITFLPQEKFDLLAPLEIVPEPETVIRVFMDYRGLDQYQEVAEQQLEKRERVGYTAIEWGGAMHY